MLSCFLKIQLVIKVLCLSLGADFGLGHWLNHKAVYLDRIQMTTLNLSFLLRVNMISSSSDFHHSLKKGESFDTLLLTLLTGLLTQHQTQQGKKSQKEVPGRQWRLLPARPGVELEPGRALVAKAAVVCGLNAPKVTLFPVLFSSSSCVSFQHLCWDLRLLLPFRSSLFLKT